MSVFIEPFNFSFFSVTGWGIDLDSKSYNRGIYRALQELDRERLSVWADIKEGSLKEVTQAE